MPHVVVVRLEKERLLIYSLGQLYQSQEGVLGELASTLIVDVYATDAISIERARPVLTLHQWLLLCFNIWLVLFAGEVKHSF